MGVLLHRVMLAQMHSRAHVNAERTALRLAAQFRRDVHQSRTAVAGNDDGDDGALLRLQFADGRTVEYSRDNTKLRRVESGGDKPTWREEFVFFAANQVTVQEENAPRRVVLTVAARPLEQLHADGKPPVSTQLVPMSIRAEAVIGRNLRFETAPVDRDVPE
jgi:hypothetical protein